MGKVLWFTGLSSSGKSTLAENFKKYLDKSNMKSIILDGDIIREGLCKDLGFSKEDRKENIRRISEVAKLLSSIDENYIVMVAFISPYIQDRDNARKIIGENFVEIYVSASLEVCEKRDVKGLYRMARRGEIKNFTGVSDPYEVPENPEMIIDTDLYNIDECVKEILNKLYR